MRSKWLIGLFVLSVAVNLALIGFLVGRHSGAAAFVDPAREYPRWVRTLPDSRRDTLRPAIIQHIRSMRGNIRTLSGLNREVHKAIAADPFDASRLAAALQAVNRHNNDMQHKSHQSLASFVGQLTSAERAAFAASLQRAERRSGPHGRRGPSGPPPAGHTN